MRRKVFFGALSIFCGGTSALAQSQLNTNSQKNFFNTFDVISSIFICIAAILISVLAWLFLARNKQWQPFKLPVILLTAVFCITGFFYFVKALSFWLPSGSFESIASGMQIIVAIISLITAFVLLKFAPRLLHTSSSVELEKLVSERTTELNELNQQLQLEIENRKVAEKEVAKRERRYRALMENISDGIVLNTEDSTVLYQSPSVARILGYTFEERQGTQVINYIHEDDKRAFVKLYEDLASMPGQPLPFQMRFRHKDGRYIWLEGVVTNLLHDRNVNGYVANYRDISERKKAEEKLKQERYLLRTLIDNLPVYIYIKDTQLRHVVNNKANVELIGAESEEETIGKTVLDYFDPTIAAEFMEADKKVLSSGKPVIDLEEKIIGHTKEVRWLLTSKIPLTENDKIIGLIGISRDITDRKNAEILLKELNASLALQASKLAASNAELERFAYVASHDLQEPLRMVRSFLQLLKKKSEGKLDEQSNQYIDYAVDGAERMKQLITDLLDYSRLGLIPEKYETIDTNLLVQRTAELLRESITASGTQLEVKNLPAVVAVKTQLGQVFQNLIANAIKYHSEKRPHIIIDGIEESAYWKFSVSDNGIGIDSRFFDKIFVIFQRLNNETEPKGTGIGLAICKKIIEAHGGNIWVESLQGRGSTFYFTIRKPK